jgi:endogenous inhibitor of DNA gyrase (YacG/DUF329 family)
MMKPRCPICAKEIPSRDPAQWPWFPFCSSRCRLIDLGRWLGGDYRISPADQEEDPAEIPEQGTIP